MSLVIHIPVWVLWVFGIPAGIVTLFALLIGFAFLFNPPRMFLGIGPLPNGN